MLSLIAVCENLKEVAGGLDLRKRELGLTNLCVDDVAGLQQGYSSKLFAGLKRPGDMSLPALLGALGCRLVLVSDDTWLPPVTKRHVGMSNGNGAWRRPPMLLPPPDRVMMALPAPRGEVPAAHDVICLPFLPD